MRELNCRSTELLSLSEAAKKKKAMLEETAMRWKQSIIGGGGSAGQSQTLFWDTNVEDLNLEELIQLKVSLEELKMSVGRRAEKINSETAARSLYSVRNGGNAIAGFVTAVPFGMSHVHEEPAYNFIPAASSSAHHHGAFGRGYGFF
ncbi:hypothetical protein J5N97_003396 [Dioscorea zingiberensis]|uniref:Uncharacterized protein n=1 Tax=Dioscorea zingiberensis TaxID=325984 RepID=A0A9D5D421_9LILI|nr:hypothetical protein J5N97_003353 [Dioscorea zingiberensis]KAJ0985040.1 hypothetical protein J5N97_003396 [Dioscorea zingiberensis]